MKKIIILAILIFSFGTAYAVPIVELAAPRSFVPDFIDFDNPKSDVTKHDTNVKSNTKKSSKKVSKKRVSKKKIAKKVKPKVVKVDYKRVNKMVEYGYYDAADKILKAEIAKNSKNITAQSLYAVSLAKQNRLNEAQNTVNSLLKKYPNNSNLHYAQGIIYYQKTTSSNMDYVNKSDELKENALKEFKKAINCDKNNAKAYNAAGVILLLQDDYDAAYEMFDKAVKADNCYATAIDNLGTLYFLKEDYKTAEEKFKLALKYNPKSVLENYHMAQIEMARNNYSKALAYLNSALSLNSNSSAVLNLMGKAYYKQGNEAAAIVAFKKSILSKPEFTLSYLDLSEIYEKRGDGLFAIEQLKTALTIDNDLPEAKLKIADISFANGNYNQAIAYYNQLLGDKVYNDIALKHLANAYFAQAQVYSQKSLLSANQNIFKALNMINKAIELNGSDLELYLAKLKLEKITGHKDASAQTLVKIINSPANTIVDTVVKAEAYVTLYDYKKAQETFDLAMDLSKSVDEDLYLAEILIYHRQLDSAQKVVEKILKNDSKNQEALCDLDYIQKSKKYAQNSYKTALAFEKSKNYNAEIEYLSRSIGVNPNYADAYLHLAETCEKTKDYVEAVKAYRSYLGLVPDAKNAAKIQKKIDKYESKL